ncbi:MAG: gluconokinase [Fimbriimonadaceae bacterium]
MRLAVLVMGVSGAGKTTVGRLLASRLGCAFLDADDFHPPANVAKMAAGQPLTDEDRAPWLDALAQQLSRHDRVVLACSALKASYRQRLASARPDLRVVWLHGEPELIRPRMEARKHPYMPASLLDSQFRDLEPPTEAIAVDVSRPPQAIVEELTRILESQP